MTVTSNASPVQAGGGMPRYADSLQTDLLRTQLSIAPHFRAVYGRFGLTSPQWRVLRVLRDEDGRTISGVAEGVLLDQPVVVGVVDRLARDGLVERRRSEEDRRRVHVWLTDKARALLDEAEPLIAEVYQRLDAALEPEEWKTLLTLLERVRAHDMGGGPA
ncbi:MarR family winged helix-turn-helix transcriptional regulator [Actinomadura sp. 1N219]|uniref:MarR family winged helix-turn-helix transcriptional regulator n=1 Tax=Actinomadura sp. 1N219 TaxID=3375152 RepID=UPI003795BD23